MLEEYRGSILRLDPIYDESYIVREGVGIIMIAQGQAVLPRNDQGPSFYECANGGKGTIGGIFVERNINDTVDGIAVK